MDALETLLRPAVQVLNKNIPEVTRASELCAQLSGTTVAVRVSNTALAAYFRIGEDSIELTSDSENDPDVCIDGSLLTLARMAGAGDANAIRDGRLTLTGDAETAAAFSELLSVATPDLEEGLSTLIGDVAAHSMGEVSRGMRHWARDARTTMGANIREYLQEESRDLPSRYEVERFSAELGTLRDDVDRFAAKVGRLLERSD